MQVVPLDHIAYPAALMVIESDAKDLEGKAAESAKDKKWKISKDPVLTVLAAIKFRVTPIDGLPQAPVSAVADARRTP